MEDQRQRHGPRRQESLSRQAPSQAGRSAQHRLNHTKQYRTSSVRVRPVLFCIMFGDVPLRLCKARRVVHDAREEQVAGVPGDGEVERAVHREGDTLRRQSGLAQHDRCEGGGFDALFIGLDARRVLDLRDGRVRRVLHERREVRFRPEDVGDAELLKVLDEVPHRRPRPSSEGSG